MYNTSQFVCTRDDMLSISKSVLISSRRCLTDIQWRKHFSSLKMPQHTNIVWMDLEMTGLDVDKHKILEIACLITDKDLKVVSEGPCIVIRQQQEVLDQMTDWCKVNHAKSGLTERVLNSDIRPADAEDILLKYLQDNVPEKQCPLAGNSVYMDRIFLQRYMPKVDDYLHYRIIDVSTVKELSRRWNPPVYKNVPNKKLVHRSLDDIKESIAELQYYRKHFFKTTSSL